MKTFVIVTKLNLRQHPRGSYLQPAAFHVISNFFQKFLFFFYADTAATLKVLCQNEC